jgi:anti-sigma factor RsiW
MRCEDLVQIMIDYMEDSMEPTLKEEFERHMGDCSSCLAFFETYKMTHDLTREIRCEEIPEEVQSRLKEFLKKKISQK